MERSPLSSTMAAAAIVLLTLLACKEQKEDPPVEVKAPAKAETAAKAEALDPNCGGVLASECDCPGGLLGTSVCDNGRFTPCDCSSPTRPPAGPAAVTFFKSAIAACNTFLQKNGNEDPGKLRFDGSARDPTRIVTVVAVQANGTVLIEDVDKVRLLVDTARRRITPPGGPKAVMPIGYAYCDPATFVGDFH